MVNWAAPRGLAGSAPENRETWMRLDARTVLISLLLTLAALPTLAADAAPKCSDPCSSSCSASGHVYVLDLALDRGEDEPEVVRGPVTLCLVNLNTLRYRVSVGQKSPTTTAPTCRW